MKKIFFIITSILLLSITSCVHDEGNCTETIDISDNNCDEYIIIKTPFEYKYKKLVIDGHDYYFRSWQTRGGHGSDLVHNPNCRQCQYKTKD